MLKEGTVVTTVVPARICTTLNCDIGDIVEMVPETRKEENDD